MVELPDYTLIGPDGLIRLVDVFGERSQLIVYNHMWFDGEEWQCGGCTSLTSQYVRLDFLDNYDARFVIVANGPIDDALAYKAKVGNRMDWYSSSESSFGADDRHSALGSPGGMAGLTRRLAEVAHLLQMARLSGRRPALWAERRRREVTATEPSRTGHLPINGLSFYYEVHGELGASKTSPLLLIPGGFKATGSTKSWVSAFAQRAQ